MSKSDPRPATSHITPFGLRMQPDLKGKLEQAARDAGRSLNAEIVARLEESFHLRTPTALQAKVTSFLTTNFDDIMEKVVREAVQNSMDATRTVKKK